MSQRQALTKQSASVQAFCHRIQAALTQATFEQKRQLVELLIDRVVVTDGDVEIRSVPAVSTSVFVMCVQTISIAKRAT